MPDSDIHYSDLPQDKRLALPPARQYELPGGPLAQDLDEIQVPILAEFKRGSAEDRGTGSGR